MTGASVTTDEAVRKARYEKLWEAVDVAATQLAAAIDALPTSVQDRACGAPSATSAAKLMPTIPSPRSTISPTSMPSCAASATS